MKPNVGKIDRIIRFTLSFVILGCAIVLTLPKLALVPMMWFAGALFCSGFSRVCPLYCPLKIDTGGAQ